VQHHHAHLLAVMAEHRLSGEQIGVAWDGSGQGDDGQLWGGEALVVHTAGYQRLARLRPFPLPGGEQAQREPRRSALGLLISAWGETWRQQAEGITPKAWLETFHPDELTLLAQACRRGINSPWCSSAGRLFDAVAALLGVQQHCSFEGQAAIALEALAMQAQAEPARPTIPRYHLPLRRRQGAVPWEWDWRPLIAELLRDATSQTGRTAAIALGFHQALAAGIADLTARLGLRTLLLSGGCFQNRVLLESSITALRRQGVMVHWPQQLPCNDGALAAGQLLASNASDIPLWDL
jgi:hydrogenase maturation protein HypF